jgi:diadenosine tetraphosphate (Ap4A) HIT family hydrolase
VLVPRIADARELHCLEETTRYTLNNEIQLCTEALEQHSQPYKMNVATLGNQVEQLHIHIVARRQSDAAWPGPVWGVGQAEAYDQASADELIASIQRLIGQGYLVHKYRYVIAFLYRFSSRYV